MKGMIFMKKTIEELYEMYKNGDERIYDELTDVDLKDLRYECTKKKMSEYYEFCAWLMSVAEFYNKEV